MWYEQLDGTFCVAKNGKQAQNTFMGNYLHSIVRGTPNIEELGLHGGGCLRPENVEQKQIGYLFFLYSVRLLKSNCRPNL